MPTLTYSQHPVPCENTLVLSDGYDRRHLLPRSLYRPLTPREAKLLRYGQRVDFLCRDGTARQLKVNGKVKTWKRSPDRVEVPCKYGLYEYTRFHAEGERMVNDAGCILLVRLGVHSEGE